MKKLFQITQANTECKEPFLCVRAGEKFFSFAIVDAGSQLLSSLYYYSVEKNEELQTEELINLHPELKQGFRKVVVCHGCSMCMLFPSQNGFIEGGGKILDIFFGEDKSYVSLQEPIPGKEMTSYFKMPVKLNKWISEQFNNARIKAKESMLLCTLSDSTGQHIFLDFGNDFFDSLILDERKILLSKSSDFSSHEDVLFWLLKVCELFNLPQEKIHLHISGLVDKQSSLYRSLYQYFINVEFREAKWKDDTNEYPAHFFTSLNDLYLCES
ncbi:MAG TPA: DUF3822 family protein [Chitinophagaceae bacterium]|nr:DUF3822 family protein [Chitinophagaceae bacterium]